MPMNHGGDFEQRRKEARRKNRVINLSMAGAFVLLLILAGIFFYMIGMSVKGVTDKIEESKRAENCEDSKPGILSGDCSNKGHKLVVEDGVALCRCQ